MHDIIRYPASFTHQNFFEMKKHSQFVFIALFAALAFAACKKTINDCPPGTELGTLNVEAASKKWLDCYAGVESVVFESTSGQRVELKMTQPLQTKYTLLAVNSHACEGPNGSFSYSTDFYKAEDVSIVLESDNGAFYINDCTFLDNLSPASDENPPAIVDMAGGKVRWNGTFLGRKDLIFSGRGAAIPSTTVYPKIEELFLGKLEHSGRTYENVHKIEMNVGNFCYFNQSNGIVAIEADGQIWSRLIGN